MIFTIILMYYVALQGYMILLGSVPQVYIVTIGLAASRKKMRREGRLHLVKIIKQDSRHEPILLDFS